MSKKSFDITLSDNTTSKTIFTGVTVNIPKEKEDKRIEDYIIVINQLYKDTGLKIKETYLYDNNSKIVADVLFNIDKDEYYAKYKN